jgi:tRNA pseudouridine38-40 synthase
LRYLVHSAFKGSNFSGWQTQANAISVQQTIETALSNVLGEKTLIHGCGRTDAGVHASQYFFHFNSRQTLSKDFIYILNKNLPEDISLFNYVEVDPAFNAQLTAFEREYKYYVHTHKNAFLSDLSTLITETLDTIKMEQACLLVPACKDFEGFTITPDRQDNTLCKVRSISLIVNMDKDQLCFTIHADRFIRGMVRMLVGNILEIGKGKLSLEDFKSVLHLKKPLKFTNLAYPQGLYLSSVKYPDMEFPVKGKMPF